MQKKITVLYERCTGCRLCEIICSLGRSGQISHSEARINVRSFSPGLDVPILCVQCIKAPCIEACPVDAIRKNEQGIIEIIEDECTGCELCIEACPADAIKMHPKRKTALKCDLCSGNPQCIEYCPTGALDYHDVPFDTRVYAKKPEEIAKLLRKSLLGLEG